VNTTTLVRDGAVPLTYNLSNTEAERITKSENSDLEIKNIWTLNNVPIYPLLMSAEGVFTRNFLKYTENIVLAQKISKSGGIKQYSYCYKRVI
jgi:hypothetical protein